MSNTVITEDQMAKIRQILMGLRYGAMVAVPPQSVNTVDSLIQFLEYFSLVLADVADANEKTSTELMNIRNDLESVGRLFNLMGVDR